MNTSLQLYDIHKIITDTFENPENYSEETGELLPEAARKIQALELGKERIIKDVALYAIQSGSASDLIASEIKRLQGLKKSVDVKQESAKRLLKSVLTEGEKYQFENVKISWRKSESVEVDELINIGDLPDEFVKVEKSVRKDEIKKAFKSNKVLPEGISIKINNNLVIQ